MISRRGFLAQSMAVAAAAAVSPRYARAAAPIPGSAAAPILSSTDADYINYALRQGIDQWGEELLARPDGPAFDAVKALLGPANIASQYVTESGWYYLPFTDRIYDPATWLQQRDFAIHVADGSQVTSQWCWADFPALRQYTDFQVGSASEAFGSATARVSPPKLWGGYLPILQNTYADADGTRWERESFAARVNSTAALVSFVHLRAYRGGRSPATARLRLFFHVDNVDHLSSDGTRLTLGANSYLVSSVPGTWNSPNFDIAVDVSAGAVDIYLALLNTPSSAAGLSADAGTYQRVKESTAIYWRAALTGGARVSAPEPYAMDAMRNLLLQNLVMAWQQSIANGYESTDPSFAFIPEVSTSVAALGEFGFLDAYRSNLQQLLAKGQGPGTFPNWEKGIKLQGAANYYLLSADATYIQDNLATFQGYLDDFQQQRAADPNGLLEKEQYGSDIPLPVYGVHHQSEAWRGMRDMGLVLQLMGETTLAARFLQEASGLSSALLKAIESSWEKLPDGSVYIPISLLDPTAPTAYELIAATRDGSYWNLTIHYAMATGILPPGSAEARGVLRYLYQHGALLLGLNRFNEPGIDPPGVIESGPVPPFPAGAGGYDAPGVDEQYGYSLLKFLGDNQQADRLVMTYYGKLAQDLTPHTFIGGEGTTISPNPDLPAGFRSQWFPPLSANNAVYLRALRELLLHEERDETGMPSVLHITPATPRGWLADGAQIGVRDFPTLFGPVAFSLSSQLNNGRITAVIQPPEYRPGGVRPEAIILHCRTPAGTQLSSVTVNGQPHDFTGETVDLGMVATQVTVELRYHRAAITPVNQARPTVVLPTRLIAQPGDSIPLQVTVEAIGDQHVTGELTITAPSGWQSPGPVSFNVASNGRIAWQSMAGELRVPSGTSPGGYRLTLTAQPDGGPAVSREVTVQVAVPSALPYPTLVENDGPTGYWRLGETSGGTATDSSGNGGNGTYEGDVILGQPGAIAGDSDGAVRLTGGYVLVPDSPAISFTGPFTLEAWVMVTTSHQQGIIEKYDTPAFNGYVLRTVQANKLFAQTLTGTEPLPPSVTGPTTILPGLWHHIVEVFDGQTISVFLDGEEQASAPSQIAPTSGANPLKLGARGDDANERLDGWLDEVAIYPVALSTDRIRAHYFKGVLGAPR